MMSRVRMVCWLRLHEQSAQRILLERHFIAAFQPIYNKDTAQAIELRQFRQATKPLEEGRQRFNCLYLND
jgi:hypothetical protein